MTADWVVTFTFDADPSMETMDAWETQLEGFDALVSRVPGHGIDVTVYAPGDWSVFDALAKMAGEVMPVDSNDGWLLASDGTESALQHGSKTLMASRIVDAIVTFLAGCSS